MFLCYFLYYVLLILAGITIGLVTGDNGILSQATRAKEETERAKENEINTLTSYEQIINANTGVTLDTITGNETSNTVTQDSLGNRVVVPAGFKVINPTDNVEDGIIIEDVSAGDNITKGSQFVWIPVGIIHKNDKEDITINLDRYTFENDGRETAQGNAEIVDDSIASSTQYKDQELSSSASGNMTAKDIEDFLAKAKSTGGYYLGRYEARDGVTSSERTDTTSDENPIVCIKSNYVYNYVTQTQAANLSQNMYLNTNFTSDLINSYAWDTAIVFLQKCSINKKYSKQISLNEDLEVKGTNDDVLCNIYDMSSNCLEWSTETSNKNIAPCVSRGGRYGLSNCFTSGRYNDNVTNQYNAMSFRPILYL